MRALFWSCVLLLSLGVVLGCSPGGGKSDDGSNVTARGGRASGSGGSAGGSSGGAGATGAGGVVVSNGGTPSPGTGGARPSGGAPPMPTFATPDAGYPDVRFVYEPGDASVNLTADSACASTGVTAVTGFQPADIIMAIDTSCSMDAEAVFVQTNINAFSQQIIASGIDAHVVLVSALNSSARGVCVPTPLGSGVCPGDSQPPNFLHVDATVGSNNAPQVVLQQFANYSSMLRPDARTHVIFITDDNANGINAVDFTSQFNALLQGNAPGKPAFVGHGIYSYTAPLPLLCGGDLCCNLAAAVGTFYDQLVTNTGGVRGNLCQQDFASVFNAVAQQVIAGSEFLCDIPVPGVAAGLPNFDAVELVLRHAGDPVGTDIPKVQNAASCTAGAGGWHFDNPSSPSLFQLCPATCDVAKTLTRPDLEVLIPCQGS